MRLLVRNFVYLTLAIATVVALAGNARAASQSVIEGPCGTLFGARVCTAYVMRAGQITEFSLRVPVAMIEHAPANAHMASPPRADLEVPFAPDVEKQTGFRYANIYWEVHGHGPAPYKVPHFDFHFYVIPEQSVAEIDCKDTVRPRAVPAGYILPDVENGACVPDMGMHAAPATDFNPQVPWKGSLLTGYYGGKPIFVEPMLTTALLREKHSFSLPVPRDIEPAAHVRYPKRFRAVFLPKIQAYDLTFLY